MGAAGTCQILELELGALLIHGVLEPLRAMFELLALWMIIGLFCAGFWLVVSASWA